jgi:hypothetical protein
MSGECGGVRPGLKEESRGQNGKHEMRTEALNHKSATRAGTQRAMLTRKGNLNTFEALESGVECAGGGEMVKECGGIER